MEYYNNLSRNVKDLIDECIERAVEMVEHMDDDLSQADIMSRTRKEHQECIEHASMEAFEMELDPVQKALDCPRYIIMAIKERIATTVAFNARVL